MPTLPTFNPANFTPGAPINNLLFPLRPGTIQSYSGTFVDEDGETHTQTNDFFVTGLTEMVDGVRVVVVRDVVYEDGVLIEDTIDRFAQDKSGNVWYLGEITNAYEFNDDGTFDGVSHEGAWTAGVNGALPGFQMEASPHVGDSYFQEFAPGIAVDEALVTATNLTVKAGRTYQHVLSTTETTALEPGVIDFKYYAPGIGLVRVDEDVSASGQPSSISTLVGTRVLSGNGDTNRDTPEVRDFAGSGGDFTISMVSHDTDSINALGAYIFDLATGQIKEGWIVYDAIGDAPLAPVDVDVDAGEGLGLFLIPNADETGVDWSDFDNGGLFFVNMLTGAPATIADGMAPLMVDNHGDALPVLAFHALGSAAGYNLLNPGAGVNAIEGHAAGFDDVICFEDSRITDPEHDRDFDDLILAISGGPAEQSATSALAGEGFANAHLEHAEAHAAPLIDHGLWLI